jgi:hypothetical protein
MVVHARGWIARLLLAATLIGAAGCKQDEALGGVDADREVSSLDADEWAEVCDGARRLTQNANEDDDVRRGRCLSDAQLESALDLDAENRMALCESALDRCLARPLQQPGACAETPPATCDITNERLERCLRAGLETYRRLGREHTCASLLDQVTADLLNQELIRACQGFGPGCNELFGPSDASDAN